MIVANSCISHFTSYARNMRKKGRSKWKTKELKHGQPEPWIRIRTTLFCWDRRLSSVYHDMPLLSVCHHLSPGVSCLLDSASMSLPGVLWPSRATPWCAPCDSLTGDSWWRCPKRVSCPAPGPPCFFFISCAVGSCLVHFQSVVLVAMSDHFRCRSLGRDFLMNVCTLLRLRATEQHCLGI